MNTRNTIAAIVGTSALLVAAGSPVVYAGNADKSATQASTTQESREQSAIKDAWLDGKLESALLFNGHLNSFDIDTEVQNGTAYLSGAVESDIDRDLAGEIAKSIKGISEVENNLVVDKSKAGRDESEAAKERRSFVEAVQNATLTARIKTKLLVNSNTGGMAIDVDSRDGVVTLSGDVRSMQEAELAEKIAENTEGAEKVHNQLTVASNRGD